MKYLVLLAVLLLVYLLWRHERRSGGDRASRPAPPPPPALPQEMVRCPVCSVHLPRADALPDPSGRLYYCCAEHRRRHEA